MFKFIADRVFGRSSKMQMIKRRTNRCISMDSNWYTSNPVVHRCVSYVSTSGARVAIKAVSKVEGQEVNLQKLLDQPNPQQTQVEFLEYLFSSYLLTGNAYAIASFKDNVPVELRILNAERVEVIRGRYGYPEGYVYRVDGEEIHIPYEAPSDRAVREVLHIKNYNPTDDFLGCSPFRAVEGAIRHMNLFDNHSATAVAQAWRPAGIFYCKSTCDYTPNEYAKLEAALTELVEDPSGRPIVLSNNIRWEALPQPQPPSYTENTKEPAKRILQALGVPPELLGIETAKFANYSESRKQFWQDTVVPLIKKFSSALDKWLTPAFAGTRITWNEEDLPKLD